MRFTALETTQKALYTNFPDESEPYVFTILYQMGLLERSVYPYEMTYTVRPHRVPYKSPTVTSSDLDKTLATIYVKRISKPEVKDTSGNVVTVIDQFDTLLNEVSSTSGFNEEVRRRAILRANEYRPNNVKEALLTADIYIVAIQDIILDVIQANLIMHYTSVAGKAVLRMYEGGTASPDKAAQTVRNILDKEVDSFASLVKDVVGKIKKSPSYKKDPSGSDIDKNAKSAIERILRDNTERLQKLIIEASQNIIQARNTDGSVFMDPENMLRVARLAGTNVVLDGSLVSQQIVRDAITAFLSYAFIVVMPLI